VSRWSGEAQASTPSECPDQSAAGAGRGARPAAAEPRVPHLPRGHRRRECSARRSAGQGARRSRRPGQDRTDRRHHGVERRARGRAPGPGEGGQGVGHEVGPDPGGVRRSPLRPDARDVQEGPRRDQGHGRSETAKYLAEYELLDATEEKRLAKAELERAKAVLELKTIRSPINGVVVERLLTSGEFTKQAPIVRLAQTDPLRVEMIVPRSEERRVGKECR